MSGLRTPSHATGAEAILVLGVISSISIVDGAKQIYDAATNAQRLPETFRDVAGRLPIVRNILASAKQNIDKGDVDEDSCKGVKHVVEVCEKKAKKLDELLSYNLLRWNIAWMPLS